MAGSCFLAAGRANAACACTGMYAGKGVTTDGSVLIGRTVDFPPYNATMRQQICERGAQVSFGGHTNRYRYVCAPKSTSMHAGRYAGSSVNEKGVILTGTITGAFPFSSATDRTLSAGRDSLHRQRESPLRDGVLDGEDSRTLQPDRV